MKKWLAMLFGCLVSNVVFAEDIQIVGSFKQPIKRPAHSRVIRSSPAPKQVTLLKATLSENARQKIEERANDTLIQSQSFPQVALSLPAKVQLGMGNTPILDQGQHGSCVVFALTAAIDALDNKGDYISQLCLLQLSRYFKKTAYGYSAWDGALSANDILNQLHLFGMISKSQQKANGCGGLTEYPLNEEPQEPGTEISVENYHQLSEQAHFGWSDLLDIYQVMLDNTNTETTLEQVKVSLNAGDRLTFATLLPAVELGVAGAIGKHQAMYDSWVLTPEIAAEYNKAITMAAHELIITGYDDDAVAIDEAGNVHKGLLTLRNSWGTKLGNQGEFYMSYDYFKAGVIEAQRIRKF